MMKHILFTACLLISGLFASAQKKEWKQMEDFHAVISKTFHPAEEGNLKPVRENADELVTKARAWQAAVVPAGYNATLLKPFSEKLLADCRAVKQAVTEKKDDATLKSRITAAHETFHQIMEKCEEGN